MLFFLNISISDSLIYPLRTSSGNSITFVFLISIFLKPLCVCEITDVLQLAISTVSKHLSILKETGFIIEEKDGKWVNYMINLRPDDPRISSILSTLDFWIADQKIISEDKAKVTKVDRHVVCAK